ncbi:MAG: hypothetical protein J7521_20295 [Caulobacter sp.]|nr:hypothetical protein [Caulobacter sp.]
MKQSHRLALKGIAEVLDTADVPWRAQQGGKHLCVIVTGPNGEEHKMPVSGSPRDADAVLSFQRQQAQRILVRLGIGFHRGARHAERKCCRKGPPPPKATVLTFDRPDHDKGPYRDPWAAFRERST